MNFSRYAPAGLLVECGAARLMTSYAQKSEIKKLVFAHIGRPTIKAMDAGKLPLFGELGEDGAVFKIVVNSGSVATYPRKLMKPAAQN